MPMEEILCYSSRFPRKIYLLKSLFLFFSLFLFSCQKDISEADVTIQETEIPAVSDTEFFSYQNKDDVLKNRIIAALEQRNAQQGGIVCRSAAAYGGFPLWDQYVSTTVDSMTRLLVPMVDTAERKLVALWRFDCRVGSDTVHNGIAIAPPALEDTTHFACDVNLLYDYFRYRLGYPTERHVKFEEQPESAPVPQNGIRASSFDQSPNCRTVGIYLLSYDYSTWLLIGHETVCTFSRFVAVGDDDELLLADGGNGNSGGGGTFMPPLETPELVAPMATKLLRNSNMSIENWKALEKMLEKILSDCLGKGLYNGLVNALNGGTLSIQFGSGNQFSFNSRQTIGITLQGTESNIFFHELWHAYQAYQETAGSFRSSYLNQEIEARYAQYLYLSRLPEYSGSVWEDDWTTIPLHRAIGRLSKYIGPNGKLKSGIGEIDLETHLLNTGGALRQSSSDYRNLPYDDNRLGAANFKNVQTLSINC